MKKTLLALAIIVAVTLVGGAAAAQEAAPEKAEAAKPAVKAETMTGTLSMVVAEKKVVVLTGSSGIPYNFKVTSSTRIKIDGKKAKFDELSGQTKKSATVKFLPLHAGNMAQSIEVGP
jgi:hypothetical protein